MKRVFFFILLISISGLFGFRQNEPEGFSKKLSDAALARTELCVVYNGSYMRIGYPGGDVPPGFGVCTDVLIRSYRVLGVDLQKDVHLDMKENFSNYPSIWGLNNPDTNIDHRRVLNLRVFFSRKGVDLPVTVNHEDYLPGDIISWKLDSGLPHIGILVDRKSEDGKRYLVVHNISAGPELEDVLFDYMITGHYRYYGGYTGEPVILN